MINKQMTKTAVAALGLGLALGLGGCGGTGTGPAGDPPSTGSTTPAPSSGPGSGAPTDVADADVTFVQGMIPHHAQAVTMSDTLLSTDGVSAGTKALAQQVKAAQQPEIGRMKGWLTAWGTGGTEHGADHGMGHGMDDGMATDAELEQLDRSSGADAERLYLEMMTKHHQGAIAMARTELTSGRNPDAIGLAGSIVSSQQAEIDTMKGLLAQL